MIVFRNHTFYVADDYLEHGINCKCRALPDRPTKWKRDADIVNRELIEIEDLFSAGGYADLDLEEFIVKLGLAKWDPQHGQD